MRVGGDDRSSPITQDGWGRVLINGVDKEREEEATKSKGRASCMLMEWHQSRAVCCFWVVTHMRWLHLDNVNRRTATSSIVS